MDKERQLIVKTERMIDDLKAVCGEYGLSNTGNEYKIIADSFLYKYLNDKFLYEFKRIDKNLSKDSTTKEVEEEIMKLSPAEMSKYRYGLGANVAYIRKEFLVSYLFNNKNSTTPKFFELFDNALDGISNDNIDIFSVRTGSKEKIKLFSPISQYIIESNKKNDFAKAIIDKLVEFSFDEVFEEKYDFFATIFEYLIKDYNKDFGKYAEYYTPNSIARIIAKILVPDTSKVRNVSIYDPAAGSGTLLLALAHEIGEEDCTLYTQDISQKSNEFLRLNLILNNLVHSLDNVVHGNTLLNPAHLNKEGNKLAQFDYIVSNPPFKTDFSDYRDKLADDKYSDRFFAGVPNIPNEKVDSMAIYLTFIQHIMYSLKDNGKAAIVVPTGFLTAKNGIEYRIREKIIDNNWLSGVISMPSNIFATTGTNVSIMFIDKGKTDENCFLMDATTLGTSEKIGKIKKTILKPTEQKRIVEIFKNKENVENISVLVKTEAIKNNRCYFNAGQYFDVQFDTNIYNKGLFNDSFAPIKENIKKISIDNEEYIGDFISSLKKVSFVTENVEMTYNDILKQDIPTNWEVKQIKDCILKISTGLNPRDHFKLGKGNIKYITVKNLNTDDSIDFDNCDVIDEEALQIVHARSDISKGDILFSSICPLGRCYLIDEKPKGWDINESVFSIRPNSDVVTPEYLYLMFKHPAIVKKLTNKSTGSIFKGIRQDDILKLYIPIPDKNTMNSISQELRKMIKLKRNINEINKQLDKSKDLIIPLMMNGQIKIED